MSPLVSGMEERRRVREERERHDAATRGREKEKARGWERERKNDRERNIACAESPVQTLSRAFSIMQIESDWLRSGFSTAVLSFRAPEFSPRYASYPLSTLSNSPSLSSPFSAHSPVHVRPARPTGAALPRELYPAGSPTSRG